MNPATFNYAQELLAVMRDQNEKLNSNPFNGVAINKFSEAWNELPTELKPTYETAISD